MVDRSGKSKVTATGALIGFRIVDVGGERTGFVHTPAYFSSLENLQTQDPGHRSQPDGEAYGNRPLGRRYRSWSLGRGGGGSHYRANAKG